MNQVNTTRRDFLKALAGVVAAGLTGTYRADGAEIENGKFTSTKPRCCPGRAITTLWDTALEMAIFPRHRTKQIEQQTLSSLAVAWPDWRLVTF